MFSFIFLFVLTHAIFSEKSLDFTEIRVKQFLGREFTTQKVL